MQRSVRCPSSRKPGDDGFRSALTEQGWDAFATRHPELFERGFLGRHYRPETLASARAREVFVLERISA